MKHSYALGLAGLLVGRGRFNGGRITLTGLAMFAASLAQLQGGEMKPTHADIRYGVHDRNVMDVYLAPGEKPTPCVLVIHGGGWLLGDKGMALGGLQRYLDEGISVVTINYRYIKQTIVDSGSTRGTGPVLPRGDYPEPPVKGPLEDSARALQFIRHHAATWNIDPVRIAVTGGSAGGCSALWLNYHDDMAEPDSDDPVKRQSTKPYCAAADIAQTSLDPKQILEWIPNGTYGGHAFGFIWDNSDPTVEIRSFLQHREEVLHWIKEYSPYELATKNDPPVFLRYGERIRKGQEVKETTHSSNYGPLLAEKLEALGLEYELVFSDTTNPKHRSCEDYLINKLKKMNSKGNQSCEDNLINKSKKMNSKGIKTMHENDMADAIADQTEQPGSFIYGGQPSATLLPTWARTEAASVSPEGRQVQETTWREPAAGLVATWRAEHLSNGGVEYRWIFENQGTQPTKALTDVAALDLTISNASQLELVSSLGGLDGPAGFLTSKSILTEAKTLSSDGSGRSSNKDLPLWVIHNNATQSGKYMGVGWSGEWKADFRPVSGQDASRLTVGMPNMNIALPVGERIVSPSVLVGDYQGNLQAGCNALRRVIDNDYVAKLGSGKLAPPVSWNSWFGFQNGITDEMLRQQVDAAAGLGVEYFCIDAGWFPGDFPAGVGNWALVDSDKFPNGLKAIGDYVAQKGMKLGLWFEPTRAMPRTRLATEHPEWVDNTQVKMEIPAARDYLFTEMCKRIDEGNVGWIRYDMNHGYFPPNPLTAWNSRDTPTTQGLTQIRYLQGEYELFDRLRAKYPDMVIESCASGGRRIDLETIRRAHTFWKSDETNKLDVARSQETGGNMFLPGGLLNSNLPRDSGASAFDLHSLFAGPLGFTIDWTKLDEPARERVKNQIAAYKTVRELLNKDYYPLFPQTMDLAQWVGWQFFDPVAGEGVMIVLRGPQSPDKSAVVRLGGVDGDKKYTVRLLDGSRAREVTGKELLSGLAIELDPGSSEVLRFSVTEASTQEEVTR
jgi:alpha-galactosidase